MSLEDKTFGASEVSKSREVIRTVHQRRMRGNNRSHREKSRQEIVYRHFDHRDIRDSEEKMFRHFDIVMFETPIGDKAVVL
jgi:hypothetical protein